MTDRYVQMMIMMLLLMMLLYCPVEAIRMTRGSNKDEASGYVQVYDSMMGNLDFSKIMDY